ncbi:hypothetical protein PR202_gb02339 [Eleusine coracana subsp. coracana]|uniref:SOSEKI DIX-like domain-containing protein n=1 Tax=Eleusine coracana subsp. coracana TaxID=191504 RepID=A0AAV5DZ42_ELECO|nr:hypothetical protein PR202_gb02339 [Eleusine coracana subsp. coracana]
MEARPTRRRGTGTGTGTSPGRNKVWVEPPGKSNHRHHQTPSPTPANRVAVVYYLCRNRHLEHPHFIEVPLASPEEGLYLRGQSIHFLPDSSFLAVQFNSDRCVNGAAADVINRLNVLRGKGMAAMYSWSCKRSYKNGFVWHDLSDDDLVLPAQGNEYILKGSELLDRSPPPDRQPNGVGSPKVEETLKQPKQESPQSRGSQEGCSSSSSPSAVVKEVSCLPPTPRPQQQAQPAMLQSSSASTSLEDGQCRTPRSGSSGNQSPEPAGRNAPLSEASSPAPLEYRVCKPIRAQDAATQTDDTERDVPDKQTHMVSIQDGTADAEIQECHQQSSLVSPNGGPEIIQESPAMCSSDASPGVRVETLESLIRAEASRRSSFRALEEEHMFGPAGAKFKPANLLMQLITCGSISVKEHRGFGFIPTYRPRFTQVEFPSPVFSTPMALRHLDKIPCNSRMVGTRSSESEYFSGSLIETQKQDVPGRGAGTLKRSSSYDEDRYIILPQIILNS